MTNYYYVGAVGPGMSREPPQGNDGNGDGDDQDGVPSRDGLRRVVVTVAVFVAAVVLLSASVSALQTQGNCDVAASTPTMAVESTYADRTLSVTHAGGDAIDRHAADRTSVVVENGGDRAEYPFPPDGPYPFTAGDTLAVENVTVGGDPLSAGDRVTVRYDTGIDYDWFCLDRSDYRYYADGELAANGTVV